MQKAKKGDTVKVHYTGKLENGEVFDTSYEREPIEFELGAGRMLSGFENAAIGMAVGEKKNIEIAAKDGYGLYREDMLVVLDRDEVPVKFKLVEGMVLQLRAEDGNAMTVTVKELTDDKITLDGNHSLAGKDLFFDMELVSING